MLFWAIPGWSPAVAYEEPAYRTIEEDENFELRQYDGHIVAEATVEGDFTEAGKQGFRLLFKYISGENEGQRDISMTAPVSQAVGPEKIEMTVPVSQERQENTWRVSFFMPARHTLETLPRPLSPDVRLRKVPPRLVAVLRYSGTWSEERYERHRQMLYDLLAEKNLRPVGEPILARYNSPFSLWFLRRNEVMLEVESGK
jgi:hypothetical protein